MRVCAFRNSHHYDPWRNHNAPMPYSRWFSILFRLVFGWQSWRAHSFECKANDVARHFIKSGTMPYHNPDECLASGRCCARHSKDLDQCEACAMCQHARQTPHATSRGICRGRERIEQNQISRILGPLNGAPAHIFASAASTACSTKPYSGLDE